MQKMCNPKEGAGMAYLVELPVSVGDEPPQMVRVAIELDHPRPMAAGRTGNPYQNPCP